MAGPVPAAPLNQLGMLSDYIVPEERIVACPNQDVVYGAGALAFDQSPAVIQVPDFGERFWVYQIVDLRSDSFVQLGKMYGTTPGFYMLVGPNRRGEAPKGVLLDTPEHIADFAPAIRAQAVITNAMPPNNITEMTADERAVLARWLENGKVAAK